MPKIVLTQPLGLTAAQLVKLKMLGNVTAYDTISKTVDEWLERVKGADIIYTNHHGFNEGWTSLHDTFVTLPFVGVNFLDVQVLREHHVVVSRSPGCNRVAVSEWIVGMLLGYARQLPVFIGTTHFGQPTPFYTTSIYGKTACIVGKGYIGSRTGEALVGLGMQVNYYTRNDNLAEKIKDADYIIDCLGLNPSTTNFYNEAFFNTVKPGVVFISVSSAQTKDSQAVLDSLASGKVGHYITDNAQSALFDTDDEVYRSLAANPNITVTPHIAAYSDNTRETATKMCIENIKAYLAGKPINLVQETGTE
jgi:phosphoglycerate dehydrogenase-like enzyme